jgi:hypothetical protein
VIGNRMKLVILVSNEWNENGLRTKIDVDCHTPVKYLFIMVIIETPVFTRRMERLLSDDEYRELQSTLILDPGKGKLIEDGGGIGKLRWSRQGTGRSGGVRIIYYWVVLENQINMLLIYPKS